MSEEQLTAFLAALKADAGLQEKLKGAEDLDAWLRHQAQQTLRLSDEELEGVAGGTFQTLPFDTLGCYGCE
jgi:hypothetical protein